MGLENCEGLSVPLKGEPDVLEEGVGITEEVLVVHIDREPRAGEGDEVVDVEEL